MYDSLKFEYLGEDGQYHQAELRIGVTNTFLIDGVSHTVDPFSLTHSQDVNEDAEEPIGTEQA